MERLNINGYYDLNITYKPDDRLLTRLIEFDYKGIALNYTVNVSEIDTKSSGKQKRAKSSENSNFSLFPRVVAQSFQSITRKYHARLKVFLRITVIFRTADQLKSVLNSPDIKNYDLIAVLPISNAAYQHACTHHSIDLISFEIGVSDYKPSGKMHKQLVERSGYFEICYSQALRSSTKRQEIFTMTQYYFIYGNSKNAIISSGAEHHMDLRNPFDVANLGLLFGLSGNRGKSAVSHNCRLLLLAAAGRRFGKTAITVELLSDKNEEPIAKYPKLGSNNSIADINSRISSRAAALDKE